MVKKFCKDLEHLVLSGAYILVNNANKIEYIKNTLAK